MIHLKPNFLLTSFLACSFLSAGSCQDRKFDPYNETDYKEVYRGKDHESDFYAVVSQHQADTQYALVKFFLDSSCNTDLYIKVYRFRGREEGPMEMYSFGKRFGIHHFKQGKLHGDRLTLNEDGTVAEKQVYEMGKKTGVWELYDTNQRLVKKKYYSQNRFIKQEIYNPEGKLVRTELKETNSY